MSGSFVGGKSAFQTLVGKWACGPFFSSALGLVLDDGSRPNEARESFVFFLWSRRKMFWGYFVIPGQELGKKWFLHFLNFELTKQIDT